MAFQDLPIKRKVMAVIMLTSITVLLLTAAAFMVYDLITFQTMMKRNLNTLALVTADYSTAALAFQNEKNAYETLYALHADPHIVAAALYDGGHNIYARYPTNSPASSFPAIPGKTGPPRLENGFLVVFKEVAEKGGPLGTLYLKFDRSAVYERLRLYGAIALMVLVGSVLVALALSNALQQRISQPILALADTARVISERRDYSVRAQKLSGDEVGLLTDAFNQMLTRIQEAEEVRSFLAAIVDSSDDAVIGKDLEGRIVSWNTGAERMFGYGSGEMLGQPVLRIVSPDRPNEESEILREAREGKIRHYETVRIRKNGQPIDVSLTISPIKNARGEIIGVSSIARDVTERNRVHEALERQAATLREQAQMLDLANVMARDLDDHIILWNSGMQKMYGWTRNEALGKISHALLQTELPEPAEQIRATLFREGHWDGELIHVRKDGRRMSVASQWVLHADNQGKPAAILEINNDITERKQAEEQVLRMNAELEQRVQERTAELTVANKEMEAFTYSVAHDLRAPLRHIDAFSKILHEDFSASLPKEAQRYLDNIRNGSRNMSRLVDDLLNLARVGRQELRRQPTKLGALVEEVLVDLKRETAGRAIEWHIYPLPTVECDSGLMKQVFANLLSNAVKYTRPRPHAVIEVGQQETNGDKAVFVRDNGVGFNMKYADKLFGVFQRLHRAEDFEGTGVGLATVDRIVRKHGGSIWAEAAVDKGATFYFTVAGLEKKGHG